MERRYREVTLKRRSWLKKILVGIIALLLLWCLLVVCRISVWESVWKWGTNCMKPQIFHYQSMQTKRSEAPFFLWLTLPKVFAYTWQETTPVFRVIEVTKEEETLARQKRVSVSVTRENTVSLLQENIYTPNAYEKKLLHLENTVVTNQFPLTKYTSMKDLIKDYYIIDASTSPDENLLDADYMSSYDCTIEKDEEKPQILIYHSHSQEGFADSVPGDVNTTIVGAGTRLADLLREYGFQVIHHRGVYDVPSRDNAYGNALPEVTRILEENPSIEVVIDLHRDAVAEGTKLVQTIDGKNYARFMFFNGICRSTNGPIAYLNNPYLKENLAFSFQAQTIAENYFPGITRKIYLKAWRYNMHLRPRNMLIELGAQTNTVEEIMNTCDILAFVINQVLSGQ